MINGCARRSSISRIRRASKLNLFCSRQEAASGWRRNWRQIDITFPMALIKSTAKYSFVWTAPTIASTSHCYAHKFNPRAGHGLQVRTGIPAQVRNTSSNSGLGLKELLGFGLQDLRTLDFALQVLFVFATFSTSVYSHARVQRLVLDPPKVD